MSRGTVTITVEEYDAVQERIKKLQDELDTFIAGAGKIHLTIRHEYENAYAFVKPFVSCDILNVPDAIKNITDRYTQLLLETAEIVKTRDDLRRQLNNFGFLDALKNKIRSIKNA